MKILKTILLFLFINLIYSCEDVVEVDLKESQPRLVVEASILWRNENSGNDQIIKLTTTAPFFDSEIPPATDANVEIISESGITYEFNEINPGIYRNNNFQPEINSTFTLNIEYKNEFYTASEKLLPVVQLEEITQTKNGGFNSDEYELKGYYTDPADETNFYLFRFSFEELSIQIYDDEFINGNRTFAYFSNEDLKEGNEVYFEIQGISEQFYNYLYILRSQAGSSSGGPFQTQPTTVRGNIINVTNPDNFAFGYFRLSQTNYLTYKIQ